MQAEWPVRRRARQIGEFCICHCKVCVRDEGCDLASSSRNVERPEYYIGRRRVVRYLVRLAHAQVSFEAGRAKLAVGRPIDATTKRRDRRCPELAEHIEPLGTLNIRTNIAHDNYLKAR